MKEEEANEDVEEAKGEETAESADMETAIEEVEEAEAEQEDAGFRLSKGKLEAREKKGAEIEASEEAEEKEGDDATPGGWKEGELLLFEFEFDCKTEAGNGGTAADEEKESCCCEERDC